MDLEPWDGGMALQTSIGRAEISLKIWHKAPIVLFVSVTIATVPPRRSGGEFREVHEQAGCTAENGRHTTQSAYVPTNTSFCLPESTSPSGLSLSRASITQADFE